MLTYFSSFFSLPIAIEKIINQLQRKNESFPALFAAISIRLLSPLFHVFLVVSRLLPNRFDSLLSIHRIKFGVEPRAGLFFRSPVCRPVDRHTHRTITWFHFHVFLSKKDWTQQLEQPYLIIDNELNLQRGGVCRKVATN